MWILFLILLCGPAVADVYVLTAPDKSVVGLSEQNDIVIPSGHAVTVIKNKQISDLPVSMGEEKLYDFNGTKFTLNQNRVKDKNKADSDAVAKSQKRDSDRQSAVDKLKGLGLTDSEISAIIK